MRRNQVKEAPETSKVPQELELQRDVACKVARPPIQLLCFVFVWFSRPLWTTDDSSFLQWRIKYGTVTPNLSILPRTCHVGRKFVRTECQSLVDLT